MKIKKYFTISLCLLLLTSTLFGCTSKSNETGEYTKVTMNASWSYNYRDIQELTEKSDLIAVVSIVGGTETTDSQGPVMTLYDAKITELILGDETEDIKILMTGGIVEGQKVIFEIADDPLMAKGDEYLIFARRNESGTYTVLSGSQGRFTIEDGYVYSLNISNNQVREANLHSNIKVNGEDKDSFFAKIKSYIKE